MIWHEVTDYPFRWDECEGYRVFWFYPGGVREKFWKAVNQEGIERIFTTQREAKDFCEKAILKRREQKTESEVEQMKRLGKAQIETMKEMMK